MQNLLSGYGLGEHAGSQMVLSFFQNTLVKEKIKRKNGEIRSQPTVMVSLCDDLIGLRNFQMAGKALILGLSVRMFLEEINIWIGRLSKVLLLLLSRFSHVQPCVTPWTAAHQAPPSMGFSRQEYWSGVQTFSAHQCRWALSNLLGARLEQSVEEGWICSLCLSLDIPFVLPSDTGNPAS